jgi:hypothetical protein
MPQPLYTRRNEPDWIGTTAGVDAVPLPGIEPRFLGRQTCNSAVIPTELSRLTTRRYNPEYRTLHQKRVPIKGDDFI